MLHAVRCAVGRKCRASTAQRRAARVPTAQVGKQLKPQSEASMRNQRHTTDRNMQRAAQLVDPDGSECSSATTLAAAKLFVAALSTRR